MVKRVFDVVLASAALVVASPAMVALSGAIALTMGRPVLFRHRRPGKNEELFELLKFRTMSDAKGPDGALLPDGDRITRLGRFLRAKSLDELPELINVLKGDMSLVGPRPLLIRYLPYFSQRERLRHSVRPGITGWAQIHGRNTVSWDERLAYDVWYVENQSFMLDLQILAKTVRMVLTGEGVVVDPHSTMANLDEERKELLVSREYENGSA